MARRIDEEAGGQRVTHERWSGLVSRSVWHQDQCLFCRFYLPLEGPMGADWGACANPASPRDGTVTFEHDHCDAFETNDAYFE